MHLSQIVWLKDNDRSVLGKETNRQRRVPSLRSEQRSVESSRSDPSCRVEASHSRTAISAKFSIERPDPCVWSYPDKTSDQSRKPEVLVGGSRKEMFPHPETTILRRVS